MENKFAIIKTGGKQYKVSVGDSLKVEKIRSSVGKRTSQKEKLQFEDVLSGGKVYASILSEGKARKVRVLKFKPKKRYKKVFGHRQPYTEIKIDKIQ